MKTEKIRKPLTNVLMGGGIALALAASLLFSSCGSGLPLEDVIEDLVSADFTSESWEDGTYGDGFEVTLAREKDSMGVNVTALGSNGGVQLKHKLAVADKTSYKVSFDIVADKDAEVEWMFISGADEYRWYGGASDTLEAGVKKTVTGEVTLSSTSGTEEAFLTNRDTYLQIGFKTVANYKLSNVKVVKASAGSGGGNGNGGETNLLSGVTPVLDVNASGGGAASYSNGTVNITKCGTADWHIKLRYEFAAEAGATYKLSFKMTAPNVTYTAGKKVGINLDNDSYAYCVWISDKQLSSGEVWNFEGEFKAEPNDTDNAANTITSKGFIAMAFGALDKTGEIKIEDVKLVKVGGSGSSSGGGKLLPAFGAGSKWKIAQNEGATADFNQADGVATIKITNVNASSANWHIMLKCEFDAKKNQKYKVTFDIKADVADANAGAVECSLASASSDKYIAWAGQTALTTGYVTKSQDFTATGDGGNSNNENYLDTEKGVFKICLGLVKKNTTVSIKNISLVEVD